MNVNEVLVDLLQDNMRRLHRVVDATDDGCLHWQPDPGGNTIAITIWHMGRLFDVFLTRQVQGKEAADEVWFRDGWAEQTGYDPRGLGRDGWGSVNDYTREEVAAIPRLSREELLGYCDAVARRVTGFLSETDGDELLLPGAGFGGQYTRYQLLQMALMDNVRHLGEVLALKAMWERKTGHGAA